MKLATIRVPAELEGIPRLRRPPVAAVPRRSGSPTQVGPDLPQARGPQPHRRAQDQQHDRPGAARQAHGQAAHDRRDRRRPARRRDRDRLRAFGLECVVYMGAEDMRRQDPNVQRMGLLGATRGAVEAGSRTLKEAISGDPRLGHDVGATHYVLGSSSVRIPSPRSCATSRGHRRRGARADLEQTGRLPTSSWLASAAAPTPSACSPVRRRRGVELVGIEAAGEGIETGRTARRSTVGGRAACSTAATRRSSRTGRSDLDAHSSPPASTTPAPARSTLPARRGRARYAAHRRGSARRLPRAPRLEGIIPALEPSHAIAWVLQGAPRRGGEASTSSASPGAATKDLAEALEKIGSGGQRAPSGIAAAFAAARGRAALMPYLMGGFPDVEASVAVGYRLCRGRRGPGGARRAVLGPAGRWPGDPRGGRARARRPAQRARGWWRPARGSPSTLPVVLDVLREPAVRPGGRSASPASWRARGISGLIVPDLPLEESGGRCSRPVTPEGVALVPLVAPTTPALG